MKPMKAATCENENLQDLRFPLFASLKVDGFRCVLDKQALSSSLKPIRNRHIHSNLQYLSTLGFDGELLLRNEDNPELPGNHEFSLVSSAVTSADGEPDFVYWVFDLWDSLKPFCVRLDELQRRMSRINDDFKEFVKPLGHMLCENLADVAEFEDWALDNGYEGIMLRSHDGKYKFGDGTLREQVLLKRKPFVDAECIVIGFVAQNENTNEQVLDNLGRHQRSSHKDGMVAKDTLGKFLVTTKTWGDFAVGPGKMTHARAKEIWDNRDDYMGKIITFKYQERGMKSKPRLPIFKSFRDPDDMTPEKLEAI